MPDISSNKWECVTLSHIEQVVNQLSQPYDDRPIIQLDSAKVTFDMDRWTGILDSEDDVIALDEDDLKRGKIDFTEISCGVTCCLWGSAYLAATGDLTDSPPTERWVFAVPSEINKRKNLYWLFFMYSLIAEDVFAIAKDIFQDDLPHESFVEKYGYNVASEAVENIRRGLEWAQLSAISPPSGP